jgi:hypothetical protein
MVWKKQSGTHNLDVIVAPVDSPVQPVSTGSIRRTLSFLSDATLTTNFSSPETPAATVPLGYAKNNGHPFGAQMLALQGREDQLIQVMSAWKLCCSLHGEFSISSRRRSPTMGQDDESVYLHFVRTKPRHFLAVLKPLGYRVTLRVMHETALVI